MNMQFGGVYAPSTVGSFLRAFAHGHVRRLESAARRVLASLAGRVPLLPGAELCRVLVSRFEPVWHRSCRNPQT